MKGRLETEAMEIVKKAVSEIEKEGVVIKTQVKEIVRSSGRGKRVLG